MTFLRRHPWLVGAFVLALGLTTFFGVRFVGHVRFWSDPAHRNQTVAPWMTVGYVARSWNLNGHDIDAEAGLPPPDGRPLTLQEIADQRGVPVADILAGVETAIARLKAQKALKDLTGP